MLESRHTDRNHMRRGQTTINCTSLLDRYSRVALLFSRDKII